MDAIVRASMESNSGEEFDDEFYEEIEAPKFVDLSAPDGCRPENEDRYWFCSRVGCDQKHEEEMDAEAINKNFILRVMAARSPNVKLRRALYGNDASTNLKCPRTVPAKPSRSRVSRLAMISSMSHKMIEVEEKEKPKSKPRLTPDGKVKRSSGKTKAFLTTPRNRKRLSNPGTFRSVRNPKPTTDGVQKDRKVAKALIFHSPKKVVKLRKSVELSTTAKRTIISKGMKKLELANLNKNTLGRDNNKALSLEASKKQRKGREVRSRVFDSLCSQNHKGPTATEARCLMMKRKAKDMVEDGNKTRDDESSVGNREYAQEDQTGLASKLSTDAVPHSRTDDDADDMEKTKTEKPSAGTIEVCSVTDTSKCNEENDHEDCLTTMEHKIGVLSDTLRCAHEEKPKSSPEEKKILETTMESDEKENVVCSDKNENGNQTINHDEKENVMNADENEEVGEQDDKENASVSVNRKHNLNNVDGKKKFHENDKSTQKKVTKLNAKTPKTASISAITSAQGVKYRKPKPTNPKPFRLRTDERGILKEANMEKRLLHCAPPPGGNSQHKHRNTSQVRNEKCVGQTEYNVNHSEDGEKTLDSKTGIKTSCSKTTKVVKPRNTVFSTCPRINHENKEKPGHISEECSKRTKSSPLVKQLANCRGISPGTKKPLSSKTPPPHQLGVIKEATPTMLEPKKGDRPNESGVTRGISRAPLQKRRPTKTSKDTNILGPDMPKRCAQRAA